MGVTAPLADQSTDAGADTLGAAGPVPRTDDAGRYEDAKRALNSTGVRSANLFTSMVHDSPAELGNGARAEGGRGSGRGEQ